MKVEPIYTQGMGAKYSHCSVCGVPVVNRSAHTRWHNSDCKCITDKLLEADREAVDGE